MSIYFKTYLLGLVYGLLKKKKKPAYLDWCMSIYFKTYLPGPSYESIYFKTNLTDSNYYEKLFTYFNMCNY